MQIEKILLFPQKSNIDKNFSKDRPNDRKIIEDIKQSNDNDKVAYIPKSDYKHERHSDAHTHSTTLEDSKLKFLGRLSNKNDQA